MLALGVAATDLLTKWMIAARFETHESREIIPGFFSITHIRNSGVAFGILQELNSPYKAGIFSLIALAALLAIVFYARHLSSDQRWMRLALAVVMGGILGNFIDRAWNGSVLDFLEIYWRQLHWPTFNVADSAITLGILALLIDSFRTK